MDRLQEIVEELRARGTMRESDFKQSEGPWLKSLLIKEALQIISGEDGMLAYRYFCNVLLRCGCHPEDSHDEQRTVAFERARQLLIQGPVNRVTMEKLLTAAGL